MKILNEEKNIVLELNCIDEIPHHSSSHTRMIGTLKERDLWNKSNFEKKRLMKIQRFAECDIVTEGIWYNIGQFLSLFQLKITHQYKISKLAFKFYEQFPIRSKFRNIENLSLIAIYLHFKQLYVFIRWSDIIKNCYNKKRDILRCLRVIIENNPEIMKSFCDEAFRRKSILNMLIGMATELQYPRDFIPLSRRYLNEYFNDLCQTKDTVMVALIFVAVKKKLKMSHHYTNIAACNWLGIDSSVISRNKHLVVNNE